MMTKGSNLSMSYNNQRKLDNNLPEYENVKTTKIFKSVIIFLATAKWFQFFQISNYVNQAKVQIGNRFDLIVLKEN